MNRDGVYTYPLDVPIDVGAREQIEKAIGLIRSSQSGDECYCGRDSGCSIDDPKCSYSEKSAAIRELEKVILPVHRSLNPDRTGSAAEEIYLRRWQQENDRRRGLNGGYGTLELILTPTRFSESNGHLGSRRAIVFPVSQRDAEVAATLVQWFATSCGRGFILDAENECKRAREECREIEREADLNLWRKDRVLPIDETMARDVAAHFFQAGTVQFDKLTSRVIALIQAIRNRIAKAGDGCGTT